MIYFTTLYIIPSKWLSFIVCYHVIRTLFSCVSKLHFSTVPTLLSEWYRVNIKKHIIQGFVLFFFPSALLVAYIDQFLFYLMFLCLMASPTWLSELSMIFFQREFTSSYRNFSHCTSSLISWVGEIELKIKSLATPVTPICVEKNDTVLLLNKH